METFVFYSNSDFTAAQTFSLDFFNVYSAFFFFRKYFKNAEIKAKYRLVLDFVLSQPNLAKQVSSFLKQRLLYKKLLFVKQSKKKRRNNTFSLPVTGEIEMLWHLSQQ